ncbi:MAG: hypothetical protein KF842_14725 [Caulobacter sp.]|nr:hypothetical protein [Caulobacter sp.]
MDYYGRLVDTLTEIWEELDAPDLIGDADDVRTALERAMLACVGAERMRTARRLASAARGSIPEAVGGNKLCDAV